MDQKTRDKIAVVLTLLLAPLLAYLVVKNVRASRVNMPGQLAASQPAILFDRVAIAGTLQIINSGGIAASPSLEPRILDEQKRIAGLLPRRSPFAVKKVVRAVTQAPAEVPEKVIQLYLTGVVSQGESSKRTAIVNGKFVEEGQQVEGWTVVKINPDQVILENGQDKITLRVGQK